MSPNSRFRRERLRLGILTAFVTVLCSVAPAKAKPEIYQRLAPLKPWMAIVDDPSHADSAWAGISAAMPSLSDSSQRAFGWYLMYSAAAALGHVDSMRVAAESSFVYSPTDPSALRDLSTYLARAGHHLDLALASATRVVEVKEQPIRVEQRLDDLRWLGYIQMRLGRDSAAIATFESNVRGSDQPSAWVLYRLGKLYMNSGRTDLALDRLSRGLSVFPQDSAAAAQASTALDSIALGRGESLNLLHTRIAKARVVSERRYWLDTYREDTPAPKGALVDLTGAPAIAPRDLSGITVVYAWATWCGPCRKSLPQLQAWTDRPRTRSVRVLTIDAEGEPIEQARPKALKFVAERSIKLPVLFADSVTTSRWKLNGFPMTLVLKDGRIVYRNHAGELVPGLEAQLVDLGSRPIAQAQASKP